MDVLDRFYLGAWDEEGTKSIKYYPAITKIVYDQVMRSPFVFLSQL